MRSDSPLGRLLFAQDAEGNVDWQGGRRPREDDALAPLRADRRAGAPRRLGRAGRGSGMPARWSPALDADAMLDRARFERRIDTAWRRTSYSALTAAAHDAIVASEPEEAGVTDEPAIAAAPTASELPLSQMASGPQLGTLIHQALQELDFERRRPDGRAASAGWRPPSPSGRSCSAARREQAAEGLALALATPLGGELGELSLAGVAGADRLDELAFELPLAGGDDPVSAAASGRRGALLDELLPADDPRRRLRAAAARPDSGGGPARLPERQHRPRPARARN